VERLVPGPHRDVHQVIGELLQDERARGLRCAAGAGQVAADDGEVPGEGPQDRALVGLDAATGVVHEQQR
jgi:hypothetical protein